MRRSVRKSLVKLRLCNKYVSTTVLPEFSPGKICFIRQNKNIANAEYSNNHGMFMQRRDIFEVSHQQKPNINMRFV